MLTKSLLFALLTQVSGIEGQVRDARTNREIPTARVEVSTTRLPVDHQYTDSSGRFRFRLLPGRYTILVESAGYESTTVDFDVASPATPVIVELARKKAATLKPQVLSLNQHRIPKAARKEFDDARKEASRRDCAKAVTHFENGLRLFAEDAAALNDLGNCYRHLRMMDRAEDAFKRAAKLTNSVYVHLNLAELYTAEQRFNDAESVLRESIHTMPNAGDAYYGLAVFCFQRARFDEAEAAAVEADKHPHNIADLHLLLAKIYSRKQDAAASKAQLETYLKENPNAPQSEAIRQAIKRNAR